MSIIRCAWCERQIDTDFETTYALEDGSEDLCEACDSTRTREVEWANWCERRRKRAGR